jgi:hypothetical protein
VSERPSEGGREILFEFVQVGPQVRVAAVDAATGLEAVVLGPANAARADLEQLALRKLIKLMEGGDDPAPPPRKGPGTIA